MDVVSPDGAGIEKSYGMSWWKSLHALEQWAEAHPTHVKSFYAAKKHMSALGPPASRDCTTRSQSLDQISTSSNIEGVTIEPAYCNR